MPNTTNFNWPTPADTDLVKDGAAAIRNLGNGVDTSLVDLKGGTTGQVLSKASNADMDFVFITPNVGDITEVQAGTGISVASGTGPIPVITNTATTTIDAEGDLLVGDAADALQRLAIGSNGNVLTVDTAVDGKIKWAAPAGGGGKVLQVKNVLKTDTFTTTSTSYTDVTGLSLSITPSLNTSKILCLVTLSLQGLAGTNAGLSRFLRDSTVIVESDAAGSRDKSMSMQEGNNGSTVLSGVTFLDAPATTSALTYKVQVRNNVTSQTAYVNRTVTDTDSSVWGRAVSSITLMEIGA